MRETSSALLARLTRPTNFIWLAFCSAVLVYAAVAWLMQSSTEPLLVDRGPLAGDPLVPAFAVAAIAAVFAARRFPRRLVLSKEKLRAAEARDVRAAFRTDVMPAEEVASIEAMSPDERRPFMLLGAWNSALILEWAGFEVVAILGLVLAVLRRDFATYVPFGAVALLFLLMAKPRAEEPLELARRLGQRGSD